MSPLSNPFNLVLQEVTVGTPILANFEKSEVPAVYKINQGSGQQIVVELDLQENQSRTRIYAGYSLCPTTIDFDLRSIQSNSSDSRLVIPAPVTGRTVYNLTLS